MGKKIIGGWRNYESRIYGILHIFILLLSVFLIITISIDTFRNISFLNQGNYMEIQLWREILNPYDLAVKELTVKFEHHKWKYLRNRFIFFLVSIPYLNIFSYLNLNFSSETYYFLRFIPLVRSGYALAIVVGWLSYNKISSLFISYVTMLMATVYFSSLIFFVLEHAVNPMVTRYTDALWWAFMDVTTVGSNIYAVTATGKILSVVLAALGMMMFPIFTVYLTSLLQKFNAQDKETQKP